MERKTTYGSLVNNGSSVYSVRLPIYTSTSGYPQVTYYIASAWQTYTVDSSTGVITLSGRTSARYSIKSGVESLEGVTCYTSPNISSNSSSTITVQRTDTLYRTDNIEVLTTSGGTAYNAQPVTVSSSRSKGDTSYGEVTSTNSSEYPTNGVSGSYWYVKQSETTYQQGEYIDEVTSYVLSAYPSNGYLNGYWYVILA